MFAGFVLILTVALATQGAFVQATFALKPIIYYVSPLNRASPTYFYIFGAHFEPFGRMPFTANPFPPGPTGVYTGRDTVYRACSGAGGKPSLGFADLNQGWAAGGGYIPAFCGSVTVDGYKFKGTDQIGYLGLTWSDNKITLTGLGNALPAAGYHIHNGDKLLIVVFTAGGTVYALTYYTGPSF
jgi:hypothetical protein